MNGLRGCSTSLRKGQSGFSLTNVITGVAVSIIAGLAIATQLSDMYKASRSLAQQREVMDIKASLLMVMTNETKCSANILDAGIAVSQVILEANPTLNIFRSDSDRIELIPSQPIVQRNVVVPGSTTGLRVEDIQFTNIRPTGLSGRYVGSLVVTFDPRSTPRPIAPITITRSFEVASDGVTKKCSKGNYEVTAEAICAATGKPYSPGASNCGLPGASGDIEYRFTSAGIGGCQAAGPPDPSFSLAAEDCLQSSTFQCEDYSCLWVN